MEYALFGAGQSSGQSGQLGQGFKIHLFQKYTICPFCVEFNQLGIPLNCRSSLYIYSNTL